MTREQRRLRLARRQALLADVSHKAAIRSLADAVSQEARCTTLAERSRALLETYKRQGGSVDGAALAQSARFLAAFGNLSDDANKAQADARAQLAWQLEALGQAQDRAQRQSERVETAKADVLKARHKREAERGLAHNVRRLSPTPTSPLKSKR